MNPRLIRNVLLSVVTSLLFILLAVFIFDAFTAWSLSLNDVFPNLIFNIGQTFVFENVMISLITYTLLLILSLLILSITIYFHRKKISFPVFDIVIAVLAFLLAIIVISQYKEHYMNGFASGDFKTFVILSLALINPIFFFPIFAFSILSLQKVIQPLKEDEEEELHEEEIVLPENEVSDTDVSTITFNNFHSKECDMGSTINVNIQGLTGKRITKTTTDTTRVFKKRTLTTINDLPESNFIKKLYEANDEVKTIYNRLKHAFLEYGLKASVSKTGEVFRINKTMYAKITITGEHIKVYYALDPEEYNKPHLPYAISNVAGYKEIPVLYKLNSTENLNKAIVLIDNMCSNLSLVKSTITFINYSDEIIRAYSV